MVHWTLNDLFKNESTVSKSSILFICKKQKLAYLKLLLFCLTNSYNTGDLVVVTNEQLIFLVLFSNETIFFFFFFDKKWCNKAMLQCKTIFNKPKN